MIELDAIDALRLLVNSKDAFDKAKQDQEDATNKAMLFVRDLGCIYLEGWVFYVERETLVMRRCRIIPELRGVSPVLGRGG